jgi:hypothetical protein
LPLFGDDADGKGHHSELRGPSPSHGHLLVSPEEEATVTSVTDFSAMLRAKKNQPTPTSAIFQKSAWKKNAV